MPRRPALLLALLPLPAGCVDHYLGYSRRPPPGVHTAGETLTRGDLLVRLEWARPPAGERRPAVVVHPEAGHVAREMRGALFADRLREPGRPVELLEVEGAGHVFNFRDREKAAAAWSATVAFLERHLDAAATAPASEP